MDRTILSQKVTSILRDITRLTNTLYALNMADIQRYPENYEALSLDAALRCEQLTCRMRHLIYTTSAKPKREYLLSAADAQDVDIRSRDGVVEITLPGLLPKRKRGQYPEFLLDPFAAALSRYSEEHPAQRFRHCVVCFYHVYDRTMPTGRVRDYDNLEYKQLLDVAADYLLTDDTGLLCDVFHSTEFGETDNTRIFIMAYDRFPEWLIERRLTECPDPEYW